MRKTAAVTTALAMMATPAFAQGQGGGQTETPRGQTVSPAKFCAAQNPVPSKRKVAGTSGQSQWAGCITGVRGANSEQAANERRRARGQEPKNVNPARFCKTQSRKKAAGQKKSPYATCVTMFVKARNELRRQTTS